MCQCSLKEPDVLHTRRSPRQRQKGYFKQLQPPLTALTYDGCRSRTRRYRKLVSMHAEMHAIFSFASSCRKLHGTRPGPFPQLQAPCTSSLPPPPLPPPPPPPWIFKDPLATRGEYRSYLLQQQTASKTSLRSPTRRTSDRHPRFRLITLRRRLVKREHDAALAGDRRWW